MILGGGVSSGVILQRFPEKDWPDTPFIEGIEWVRLFSKIEKHLKTIIHLYTSRLIQFCQPQGWALSTERQEPRFFVSILTDIDANRHYCACMCFNETVSIVPSKPVDEEEDPVDGDSRPLVRAIPAIAHHSIMYAPKCLVLVSRLDYIETFRVCVDVLVQYIGCYCHTGLLITIRCFRRTVLVLFIPYTWKILVYR